MKWRRGVVCLCAGLAAFAALADPCTAETDLRRAVLQWREDWPAASVKIPLELYLRYLDSPRLSRAELMAPAPVDWIVARAEYHADIGEAALGLRCRIELTLFNVARVEPIPLLPAGVAWEEITVNGEPAALREEGGWLHLDLPPDPATRTPTPLKLILSARADLRPSSKAGTYRADVPTVRSCMTLLKVDSPEAWEVFTPRSPLHVIGNEEEGTHGLLGLRLAVNEKREAWQLSWQRPRPPVIRTGSPDYEAYLSWHLAEGVQEVRGRLDVRIVGGETEQLRLKIPAGADRVKVTGPDVRKVETPAGSARVYLKGRMRGATRLSVEFTVPWPAAQGRTALDGFGIEAGRLRGGALVVTSEVSAAVLEQAAQGLDEIGLWEIPQKAGSLAPASPILAYAFTGADWRVSADVVPLAEIPLRETVIDEANYTVLLRPDGSTMHKIELRVRNRTHQFLELRMPGPHCRLILVRVSDHPAAVSRTAEGVLLIPLDKSLETVGGAVSFPIEVVFLNRTAPLEDRGRLDLALARPGIPIARAQCALFVPEGLETRAWEGDFRLSEKMTTVVERLEYGRGHVERESQKQPEITEAVRKRLFADNYFDSAVRAYGRGEYDAAESAAKSALEADAGFVRADDARKLLENIAVLKGRAVVSSRAEQVQAQRLQAQETARQAATLARQEALIRKGWEHARAGQEQSAAEAFKAAEQIGQPFTVNPEGAARQEAILDESGSWLSEYEERLKERTELLATKKALEEQQAEVEKKRVWASVYQARKQAVEDERIQLHENLIFPDHPISYPAKEAWENIQARNIEARPVLPGPSAKPEGATEETSERQGGGVGAGGESPSSRKYEVEDLGSLQERDVNGDYFVYDLSTDTSSYIVGGDQPVSDGVREALGELQKEAERVRGRGTVGGLVAEGEAPAPNVEASGRLAIQRATGKETSVYFNVNGAYSAAENLRLQRDIERLKKGEAPAAAPREPSGSSPARGALKSVSETARELAEQRRYAEAADLLEKAKRTIEQAPAQEQPRVVAHVPVLRRFAAGDETKQLQREEGRRRPLGPAEKDLRPIHEDRDFIVALGRSSRGLATEMEAPRSEFQQPTGEVFGQMAQQIREQRRREGANVFVVEDLVRNEAEGRALAEFLGRNYWAREEVTGGMSRALDGRGAAQGGVEYHDGKIVVAAPEADKRIADALDNLRRNKEQKVALNTRSLALSEQAVQEMGIAWNDMANGRWAALDEGQLNALLALEQRMGGPGAPAQRGQTEIVPGTVAELSNGAQVKVQMAMDTSNGLLVNDAAVELPHERILLVLNDDRIVALRAGATQLWMEAPEAPEIREAPTEMTVPAVGVPVRFEKILVTPQDDLRIECSYEYKEGRDG